MNTRSGPQFPEQMVYASPAGTPAGLQLVVLYGDPSQAGFCVVRGKIAAGARGQPHYHTNQHHTVTVLSGTLYYATGEVFDESKLTVYPAGTFYCEPTGTPHYLWARDGEVIFQIASIGPLGTVAVPPAG